MAGSGPLPRRHKRTHKHTHTPPLRSEWLFWSWAVFSKPHTRGREENNLGWDLALCGSKHKSLGTMNNKSIQKNKGVSLFLEGAGGSAVSKKKEKKKAHTSRPRGCPATRRAAVAETYMRRIKQTQWWLKPTGMWIPSDCRSSDGIRGFFFFPQSGISLKSL